MSKKTTNWKYFTKHGCKSRIRFEYGYVSPKKVMRDSKALPPYVALTHIVQCASTRGRWKTSEWGVASEVRVEKYFPELLPLVRWHLSYLKTGPLHYIENAIYWWEMVHGLDRFKSYYKEGDISNKSPKVAREIFLRHIVFGAVEGDIAENPAEMPRETLVRWLLARQADLVIALRKDCDPICQPSE